MERSYIHAYRGSDPRYEYMRLPCVNMALFTGGKQIFSVRYRTSKGPMCADPNLAIAGPGCNHDTSPPISYTGMYDSEYCYFAMERVKYSTSKARCPGVDHDFDAAECALDFPLRVKIETERPRPGTGPPLLPQKRPLFTLSSIPLWHCQIEASLQAC